MKIKIIANSFEATELVNKSFASMNVRQGFSFGPSSEETLSQEHWFSKILKYLDKKISEKQKIAEEEKKSLTAIINTTTKLNDFFSQNNTDIDYLKNSSIFIHSESAINKYLRKISFKYANTVKDIPFVGKKLLNPIDSNLSLVKIFAGVQYVDPHVYIEQRKIVLNTDVFHDKDEGNFSLVRFISKQQGIEKSIDFTMLHEFAHMTQDINDEYHGINMDLKIQKMIKNINFISYRDFYYHSISDEIAKSRIDIMDLEEPSKPRLTHIDRDYLKELDTLRREVYADVAGLLHLRNIDIQNNNYNKQSWESMVDTIIEARHKENDSLTKNSDIDLSNFPLCVNHYTTSGLNSLKEFLPNIKDGILPQEEIHDIANMCIEKSMAEVLVATSFVSVKGAEQIKILSYLDRKKMTADDGEQYDYIHLAPNLEQETKEENRYKKFMTHLKEITGAPFVANLRAVAEQVVPHNLSVDAAAEIIWKGGFSNPSFKQDMEILSFFDDSPNINTSTDKALTAINNMRSSLSQIRKHTP